MATERRCGTGRFRVAVLAALFEISAAALAFLPAGLPALWTRPRGDAPSWEIRLVSVFGLPAALVLILAVVAAVSRGDRRRPQPDSSRRTADRILTAAVLAVSGVHLALLGTLLGAGRWIGALPPLSVGLALAAAGNVLPRLRPNAAFGVRTPWTLRDGPTWAKTHRAAGYGAVTCGLALAACAFAAPRLAWAVALFAAAGALLFLPLLSYLLWKTRRADPADASPLERKAP